jgi:hypothetical protein
MMDYWLWAPQDAHMQALAHLFSSKCILIHGNPVKTNPCVAASAARDVPRC